MAASQNAKSITEVSCMHQYTDTGDFRDALCVLAGRHLHYVEYTLASFIRERSLYTAVGPIDP